MPTKRICYIAGTSGNWGGASRVLFTNLGLIDRSRFEPLVLLSGHGPAEAILDRMDIPYEIWGPLTEPRKLIEYANTVLRTFKWLRRHHVDLIHLNRANDWRPAELLAASICRIPIVAHFHTVNTDRAPATRGISAIAAVSSYVALHSDTQGVPATVIHNSVDLDRFSTGDDLRPRLGIGHEQIVVSFVGQIRKIKGLEDFITMAKRINGDDVRFLIAGECRDKKTFGDTYSVEELHSLISHDGRIRYCGYLDQVEDIYRSSDIVVMPSRWQEPFGLVCIEAGAAGLPVVATRVGGLTEVIEDGVTGLFAEAGNIPELASQVQRLADNAALRSDMGRAARFRVEREFTDKPVRVLEQLYESLLARLSGNP